MSLNLDDPEVELALRELARETGEPLIEAARIAISERLAQLRAHRALLDLTDEARRAPVLDVRPTRVVADELWE